MKNSVVDFTIHSEVIGDKNNLLGHDDVVPIVCRISMSSQILITGATGFIGRQLTRDLVARGDRVRILAREPAQGPGSLRRSRGDQRRRRGRSGARWRRPAGASGRSITSPESTGLACAIGASFGGPMWKARKISCAARRRRARQSRPSQFGRCAGKTGEAVRASSGGKRFSIAGAPLVRLQSFEVARGKRSAGLGAAGLAGDDRQHDLSDRRRRRSAHARPGG
jgi:hypothetical protein